MAKAKTGSDDKRATKASNAKAPSKKAAATTHDAAKPSSKVDSSESGTGKSAIDAGQQTITANEGVTGDLDNAHLPAAHGKIGVFGGPKDRGAKPDDKLALPTGRHFVYERVRTLKPDSFYCAMRWDYHLLHKSPEEGKRWWANKKILVTNSKTGKAVVVRAVDYGPHENTGLDIGVSPAAAEALGVEVGDEVDIAFADQKAPQGPVQ